MEKLYPDSFGSLQELVTGTLAEPGRLHQWLSESGYELVAERVRVSKDPARYSQAVLRSLDRYGQIDETFFTKLSQVDDGRYEAEVSRIAGDMGFRLTASAALSLQKDGRAQVTEDFRQDATRSSGTASPGVPGVPVGEPEPPRLKRVITPEDTGLRVGELQAILDASRSVVQITDAPGAGVATGILVAEDLVLVPNYVADMYQHGDPGIASIRLAEDDAGSPVEIVEVVANDPDARLGLCRLQSPVGRPIDLVDVPLRPQDRLSFVHFPLGGHQRISPSGAVVLESDGIQVTFMASVHPGSGGGALLDNGGRLVGLLHSSELAPSGNVSNGPMTATIDRFLRVAASSIPAATTVTTSLRSATIDSVVQAGFDPEAEVATPEQLVVIEVADPDVDLSQIEGVKVSSRWGSMLTAVIDGSGLQALTGRDDILSIEASRASGDVELFQSVPLIHARPQDVHGEDGSDALVAIIDNGVDFHHAAFREPGGGSKIVAYWDQTDPARPCDGYSPDSREMADQLNLAYGRLYLAADLDAIIAGGPTDLPPAQDCRHGTGVASIAAGTKAQGHNAFPGGVSPASKVIVVRYELSDFPGYTAGHTDALSFIDAIASTHDMPVVVNISNGTNAGAHDGHDKLERACEFFASRPGRVVVKSAGNERETDRHCELPADLGSESVVLCIEDEDGADHIEFWWPAEVACEVKVFEPNGQSVTVINGDHPDEDAIVRGAHFLAALSPRLSRKQAVRSRLTVDISHRPGRRIPVGDWRFEFRAVSGHHHRRFIRGWIDSPMRSTSFQPSSMSGTVTIPGTTWSVVCVGAMKSRDAFEMVGSSSEGDHEFGEEKPDIVAPGFAIRAALEGSSDQADTNGREGTSFAAPHVTGAVALALSKCAKAGVDPWPYAEEMLHALRRSTPDAFDVWVPRHGYGPFDVPAFLAELGAIIASRD